MRYFAALLIVLTAMILWQWQAAPTSEAPPLPAVLSRAPAALAQGEASVTPLPTATPTEPNWWATRAAADSTSVSAQATAMWVGATGTAAYIAPTQAEEYRRGTTTQLALNQAAARVATQEAFINNGTATQQARTATQFALDELRAVQTATMFPAFQRAAAGTASAEATLAITSFNQTQMRNEALTWAFVGGVCAVPVALCLAIYMLTAAWRDRISAEPNARAKRIENGGQPRPAQERTDAPNEEPRQPIAGKLGGESYDLEMLSPEAQRVEAYLRELLTTAAPEVTVLPGRDAIGAGGSRQQAVYAWLEERQLLKRDAGGRTELAVPLGQLHAQVARGDVQ